MAQILVRRLDDEVKRRLAARAKLHGRSLEAEARSILETAAATTPVQTPDVAKVGLGTRLARSFARAGLTEVEFTDLEKNIADTRRRLKPRKVDFGA